MLINSLCKYYDTLASNNRLARDGYELRNVSYRIMLNPDGTIEEIQRCTRTKKTVDKKGKEKLQEIPLECMMPKRSEKPGLDVNFPEHRPIYIFGLEAIDVEEDGKKSKCLSVTSKARKAHNLFKEKIAEYMADEQSPIVCAYREFAEKWVPSDNIDNPMLIDIIKDFGKCGYCFALNGHPDKLLQDEYFFERYAKRLTETADYSSAVIGMCAVTGLSRQNIARIHSKIRGIRGGQPGGTLLICFNNYSDESYGKKQSANSNISTYVANKYAEALNLLLKTESHRTFIDEMTLVYWADTDDVTADNAVCDFFDLFCGKGSIKDETDNKLSSFMAKAKVGQLFSDSLSDEGVDTSIDFYVACFTPNVSRICLKYVYKNTVGRFADNIAMHQKDLYHGNLRDNVQLSVSALTKELYSPNTSNKSPSYPLYAAIMDSVLNGTLYPQALFNTIVQRCRTDSGEYAVNDRRISIIKACLNRKARHKNKKEVIPMELDIGNNSQAYLCGRLFALLECAQRDALGKDLNKTIKDSYFASACTKPATVFPRLVILAQHHLEKAKYGGRTDNLIAEVMSKFDGRFPATLTLDEQGEFIVGYYQQKQNFYTKKEK